MLRIAIKERFKEISAVTPRKAKKSDAAIDDGLPHGMAGNLLADQIERQIRENCIMPGAIFASEQDLQSQSNAGRSVVRQAVRLLTQRGVAYMRRGVGGGLIVKAPDVEVAARNLSIAIERELEGFANLLSLYTACDAYLFTHATRNVTAVKADLLRNLASDLSSMSAQEFERTQGHRRLSIAFYNAFDDAAGMLFVRAAMECGMDFLPPELTVPEERRRETFWQYTLQSVEALIAGDVARLFIIRSEQARAAVPISDWKKIERLPRSPRAFSSEHLTGLKAERLSREILRQIRLKNWAPETRLGGIEELLLQYGASKTVLREAIRILEESSSVRMQFGRSGGLIIAAPDRRKAVARAFEYLQATAYPAKSAWLFLDSIILEAIQQCATHTNSTHLNSLETAMAALRPAGRVPVDVVRRIYLALAGVAGSPALQTVAEILLLVAYPAQGADAAASPNDLAKFEHVARYIAARDPPRARRAYLACTRDRCGASTG